MRRRLPPCRIVAEQCLEAPWPPVDSLARPHLLIVTIRATRSSIPLPCFFQPATNPPPSVELALINTPRPHHPAAALPGLYSPVGLRKPTSRPHTFSASTSANFRLVNYLSTQGPNDPAPLVLPRRDPCVPKQQLQLEPGRFESALAAMLARLGCRSVVAYQTALGLAPYVRR